MKECQIHRDLSEGVVRECGIGGISVSSGVVEDGFGHTVEEETDADATREEHHEPGDPVVLCTNAVKLFCPVSCCSELTIANF